MKPSSMSIKEWLIKKMSIDLVVSEKVINSVITHQFESATNAINIHNSIEFSGFGKFMFNSKKAEKELNKLNNLKNSYQNTIENENASMERRKEAENRLVSVNSKIQSLIKKIKYED